MPKTGKQTASLYTDEYDYRRTRTILSTLARFTNETNVSVTKVQYADEIIYRIVLFFVLFLRLRMEVF